MLETANTYYILTYINTYICVIHVYIHTYMQIYIHTYKSNTLPNHSSSFSYLTLSLHSLVCLIHACVSFFFYLSLSLTISLSFRCLSGCLSRKPNVPILYKTKKKIIYIYIKKTVIYPLAAPIVCMYLCIYLCVIVCMYE